jgi:hypothetical protein
MLHEPAALHYEECLTTQKTFSGRSDIDHCHSLCDDEYSYIFTVPSVLFITQF